MISDDKKAILNALLALSGAFALLMILLSFADNQHDYVPPVIFGVGGFIMLGLLRLVGFDHRSEKKEAPVDPREFEKIPTQQVEKPTEHDLWLASLGIKTSAVISVRALLEKGASPDAKYDDWSVLVSAVSNKSIELVELLLSFKANANVFGKVRDSKTNVYQYGVSPLMAAVGNIDVVTTRLLLSHGADPNKTYWQSGAAENNFISWTGWSPLLIAVNGQYDELVRILLEAGASPVTPSTAWANNQKALDGYTPLIHSIEIGRADYVQMMLEKRPALNQKTSNGYTALYYALKRKNVALAEKIISAGGELLKAAPHPIRELCLNKEFVESVGQSKSEQIQNEFIRAVYSTAKAENLEAISQEDRIAFRSLALSAGIDVLGSGDSVEVTGIDGDGHSLLHLACIVGDLKLLERLLERNCLDVNLKSKANMTPLHIASNKGTGSIVQALVTAGADINASGPHGSTPLMVAILANHPLELIRLMLKNGANPNCLTSKGTTSFYATGFAIDASREDLLSVLLEYGADPNLKNAQGITSADLARDTGKVELLNKAIKQATPASKEEIDFSGQELAYNEITKILALVKVAAQRKQAGLKSTQVNLNAIFSGNPGTGKTTFARFYGQKLKELGLLSEGHFIEASRQDLVAGYVGQTAIKTHDVVKRALGGVLFIDEVYSLKEGEQDSFGQEAIDILVKDIEDNRDNLVTIIAGYTKEMGRFLESNSGLKSRFPNTVPFTDFSKEKLVAMLKTMAAKQEYVLSDAAVEDAENIISAAIGAKDFGNARFIRNLLERAIANQSVRLSAASSANTKEQLQTLTEDDFKVVGQVAA